MWMVLVVSFCCLFTTISTLMFCLCWRKTSQKTEWPGLDGLVTQKNPDENVNHLDGPPQHTDDVVDAKRPSVVNNPRRSLPDIPSDGGIGLDPARGEAITYEPNGDNSSDLYATVEPYHNSTKVTIPNGINARPSISQNSSISQADDTFSPYARVKEHPYDKLKKTEHPYASVQQPNDIDQQQEETAATSRAERVCIVNAVEEPVAPPRSRRSSDHSAADQDILAASAVAGGIAANLELPYMTPPVAQTNFSGDSQDSSKGYTSISVREPLANIRAQTKCTSTKRQGDVDTHYSTVSDDSDDMYTTIQDPNTNIYTSESETYAQIRLPQQITVAAEVNASLPQAVEAYEPPQPPSVDSLKHVTSHTHSRQASTSSSVGNLGSPKPEKRQANSPLPRPPPTLDLPTCKNIDDMYAKVQKNKRKDGEGESSEGSETGPKEHNYETLRKNVRKDGPGYEEVRTRDEVIGSEPGYSSINGPPSLLESDPGYEMVGNDPNYEEVQGRAPSVGYCTVPETSGYSTIHKKSQSSSNNSDEPNYESMPSESLSEPNYTPLKSGSESDPNYESVKYLDEPPYERLQDDDSLKNTEYEKVDLENGECKPATTPNDYGYETIKKSVANGKGAHESDEDSIVQV